MFTSSDSIELLDKRIDCPNELTLRSLAREAHHERLEQVLGTSGRLT